MSITFVNNKIRIEGTETGDSLRTYASSSPHCEVNGRNILFNVSLELTNNYNLTDHNSSYIFMIDARLEGKAGGVINFTDVIIRYDGNLKLHSFMQPHTQNFTRVTWILGVLNSRSDFFSNGSYTFNYNDVNLVSYGQYDYLHFQTDQTINNLKVNNAQGRLVFEVGANGPTETQTINNLKLEGVTRFVGGQTSRGSIRTNDMQWTATIWLHRPRAAYFYHVNPIKPAGWQQ